MAGFARTAAALAAVGCGPTKGEPELELPLGAAEPVPGIALEEVGAPGVFSAPVALVEAPDGRLFVADQVGLVRIVDQEGVLEEPLVDLRERLVALDPVEDERGLLGLALHPDFEENGRVFVYYSAPLRTGAPPGYDHTNVLSELTVTANDPLATERVLLRMDHPYPNHNGGALAFGPDGLLYVAVGDGGNAGDRGRGHRPGLGNAQRLDTVLGKVLRLDVRDGDILYGVPESNPFATGGGHPLVYAYGLRSPSHFSFDRTLGDLWLADEGEELMDEVDLVDVGGNYGWSVREGFLCFDADTPASPPEECPTSGLLGEPFVDPVVAFLRTPHLGPNGQPVDPVTVPGTGGHPQVGVGAVGGYVYRGAALEGHDGRYYFAATATEPAVPSGRLLVAVETAGGERALETVRVEVHPDAILGEPSLDGVVPASLVGTLPFYVLGLGEDADGELYLLVNETLGPRELTGRVFRLVPTE